jgi:hypothetical protein
MNNNKRNEMIEILFMTICLIDADQGGAFLYAPHTFLTRSTVAGTNVKKVICRREYALSGQNRPPNTGDVNGRGFFQLKLVLPELHHLTISKEVLPARVDDHV